LNPNKDLETLVTPKSDFKPVAEETPKSDFKPVAEETLEIDLNR